MAASSSSSALPQPAAGPQPIIFNDPLCGASDMIIQVFQKTFEVQSIVLKMHSTFFSKFLDSPDKIAPPPGTKIRYQWGTMIDADDTWGLTANHLADAAELKEFKGDAKKETKAFTAMLRAIYGLPSTFKSLQSLQKTIELADYYRCLPALSKSLSESLRKSPTLLHLISEDPETMLDIAVRLRHKELFTDCAIHLTTPYNMPRYRKLKKYRATLHKAWFEVKNKIHRVHMEMLKHLVSNSEFKSLYRETILQLSGIIHPTVCRSLLTDYNARLPSDVKAAFESVLETKLTFDVDKLRAGCGDFKEDYLCAELSDSDMPWDVTKTDW